MPAVIRVRGLVAAQSPGVIDVAAPPITKVHRHSDTGDRCVAGRVPDIKTETRARSPARKRM